MSKRTLQRFLRLVLPCVLITSVNANSAFWEKISPTEFSLKLTTDMLMVYFGIDYAQCKLELVKEPKSFTQTYDRQVEATKDILNKIFKITSRELSRQEKNSQQLLKRDKIKRYISWIFAVTQTLIDLGNYNAAAITAVVISLHLEYDLFTGKIGKTDGVIDLENLERSLAILIKPSESQKFEDELQRLGIHYLPNMTTLRKALEELSSKDFENKYSAIDREVLAHSICEKLSLESFSRYKVHFMATHK